MKKSIKTLKEERADIFTRMQTLRDKANSGEGWNSEEEGQFDDLSKQYDSRTNDIAREERWLEQQAAQNADHSRGDDNSGNDGRQNRGGDNNQPGPTTEETRALGLQAWACAASGREVSDEQRAAAENCGYRLGAPEIGLNFRTNYAKVKKEWRAQSTTATEGGDTIPEGFVNNLERAMLDFGGIREVSQVLRTASGNDLPWPTVDDTGNAAVIIAENTADGEQDVVTGAVTFNAYKYTSRIVRVSAELLQDSAFDFAAVLGSLLGERIGRGTAAHFATGTGTGQPRGVSIGGNTTTAAANNAVSGDDLIDLMHAVDVAYRRSSSTRFAMNDATLASVRKLKDGQGQYLWQPSLQAGDPGQILGQPITVANDLADIGSTTRSVVFGDFSKYIVRDVAGMRMKRLVERYAEFDQEAFVVYSRHDGDRIQDSALRTLVHPV